MIQVGTKVESVDYPDRRSSYGILVNDQNQIAIVRHENWGLIFPGGRVEDGEETSETIHRETLEEIGYEVDQLSYYDTMSAYYQVGIKRGLVWCHNIADIYTGIIKTKVQEPIEIDTSLEWYDPKDLFGKMKLDFQNVILEIIYNK